MNQIKNPPNDYDFGYEFDYSLWVAGTQVDLVNVPWNNDYRDVVKFDGATVAARKAALNAYIDSLNGSGIRVNNVSYVKPGTPIRLDIPHNRAIRYNYLRASNPLQPIPNDQQKDYYYFILDARYVAPNTTELVLQLDVWQTFGYDVTIGNCYLERGHYAIANANQFSNYGRDYLTTPEGLDLGSDYEIRSEADSDPIFGSEDVLVFSTVDLIASGGTVDDPVLITAPGSKVMGLPSGASAYLFHSAADFKTWLQGKANKPWITQGIISVTIIPNVAPFNANYDPVPANTSPHEVGTLNLDQRPLKVAQRLRTSWRATYLDTFPSRYRHLLKFLVAPYTILEATTFTGNSLILRPELWKSEHATFVERISIIPPNQRAMFWPWGYNLRVNSATEPADGSNDFIDPDGERLGMAIGITNFPTLPVVNNMAIGYLASNANSLAWQNSSADWAQQRALAGAQAGYDVASGAINTAADLAQIGIHADYQSTGISNRAQTIQAGIQGASSLIGGFGGGAAFGPGPAMAGVVAGGAQALAGVANNAVQVGANNEQLAVRSRATVDSTNRQNSQSALVRDTNKNIADWSARGDYANTIAGVNAKIQDARMTQPSMSGSFGGDAFNIINGYDRLYLRFKSVDSAAIARIGDYWLRYGYAIQRFLTVPQSLKAMTKFTYWKMQETYLSASNVPEGMKQAIRGILEKGVTVWSNPSYIGTTDIADNAPLEGISF